MSEGGIAMSKCGEIVGTASEAFEGECAIVEVMLLEGHTPDGRHSSNGGLDVILMSALSECLHIPEFTTDRAT